MTNEQILKKAIEKAIKNGWNPIDDMGEVDNFEILRPDGHWKGIWIAFHTKIGDGGQLDLTTMIFDHDFAKAFWGEYPHYFWFIGQRDTSDERQVYGQRRPAWQYHLQQMVLEKEPLLYLEKFL